MREKRTKEPSPSSDPSFTTKRCVDSCLEKAAKNGCDRYSGLKDPVSLAELALVIPAAQNIIKSRPISGLSQKQSVTAQVSNPRKSALRTSRQRIGGQASDDKF